LDASRRLRVTLNDTAVGTLDLNRNEGCEFRLMASYREAHPRPVLGQMFLDDPEKVHRTSARVPPWFSNLLPEGALRELVAGKAGVSPKREFELLRHLGDDLPGAVRILAEEHWPVDEGVDSSPPSPHDEEALHDAWHFSLAGVQLKFSVLRADRGLTIPVSGTGGDWIVKLPDSRHPGVPENGYATMRWAGESGIRIPSIELIDIDDISGLPVEATTLPERLALAIRRFDRPEPGRRIHIEDFAQVLGLFPEQKYGKFNCETLANIIFRLAGAAGLDEFVRRLVFIVASGNGDAHHKNWSLIYPDGVHAELSPAYDMVSTIQYMPGDRLALNLARSKRWTDVRAASFAGMAQKIGEDGGRMIERVEASIDSVLSAWQQSAADFGYSGEARGTIERHMRGIPLLSDRLRR
jgi:serine/threonine-protein kinase HipA